MGAGGRRGFSPRSVDKSPDIDWVQKHLDSNFQIDPLKLDEALLKKKLEGHYDQDCMYSKEKECVGPVSTWFTVHSKMQHWMCLSWLLQP